MTQARRWWVSRCHRGWRWAAPGVPVFGVGAGGLAAGVSFQPRTFVRACGHPAAKDRVLEGAGERERKREVDVAWRKIRWKRGN